MVDELDDDEDSSMPSRRAKSSRAGSTKASIAASKKKKTGPKGKRKPKLIYFDAVNIPKGDDTVIDKFITSRVNEEDGSEDVLVKYKVLKVGLIVL